VRDALGVCVAGLEPEALEHGDELASPVCDAAADGTPEADARPPLAVASFDAEARTDGVPPGALGVVDAQPLAEG